LSSPLFHQEEGFYLTIARELYNLPKVRSQKVLSRPFHVKKIERHTFSVVLAEWKRQGVLPVLCLDEFEALFHHPKEFNDEFFDNLSFLLNSNILMLVVASHRKLDYYQNRYRLSSKFFNLGDVIKLGDLTEEEARELVNLPVKFGGEAALSSEEQRLARQWGENHPLLLQLAASLLWEAHQQNLDVRWAKENFIQQSRAIPRTGFKWKIWPFGK
jgi:Cdc6-like AAA superfamily ATPase